MKTARQWINTISDPIVKKYLREITKDRGVRFNQEYEERGGVWDNIIDFFQSFSWSKSKQGMDFWSAIVEHFEEGSGKKSYKDFKHLDKSVKP